MGGKAAVAQCYLWQIMSEKECQDVNKSAVVEAACAAQFESGLKLK